MLTSVYFQICSLFFIVLLIIIYFSKTRLKSLENNIFIATMLANLSAIIFDISSVFAISFLGTEHILTMLFGKLYLVCILIWLLTLCVYIFVVCYKKGKNKLKLLLFILSIVFIISSIIIFSLPLYYVNEPYKIYSYGPSASVIYAITAICIVIWIAMITINFKHIKKNKCIPIIFYVITGSLSAGIQFVRPEILLVSFVETFVTFLMYFTIENPDVQMIGELYKNKKIIEKSNEDTSKFLFRITQDIRKPIKDILTISHDMEGMKTVDEFLAANKYMATYTNQLDYLINKALNITGMDTQKIKTYDNKYNVTNLFKEVSFRAQEQIKDKVKFDFTINSNIPEYLYGDSIKLKQAVSSVLNTANQNTTEGFISLDVSTIVKYNICRLIIIVEDSGAGISIDQVNQILSLTSEDLEKVNLLSENDRRLDILAVKKLVNMLGGSLMIKSELGVGTTVTITLDQKIVETEETELTKKLESYEQTLYGNKKVLVVDDDEKELAGIVSQLEKQDVIVSSSVYGRDCIEKIRSRLKYDLIILDDELPNSSALGILQELQKIKGFKTPVVVMINDNKEGIKLHYMKDGFADCISKSKLDSEINRILKRF